MREIKFRAWDKQFEIYVDKEIVDKWAVFSLDIDSVHIIEQFTGLHDKNGVEIYEGDIVTLYFDETGSMIPAGFKGQVLQSEGCWWVDNGNDAHLLWDEIAVWKIIGNIYENRELLK